MGILKKLISKLSKGPAIQNLENFDMVIEMNDGGILLPIVASKHLDGSPEMMSLLQTKIRNYVEMIQLEEFRKDFPAHNYFQIELNCIDRPDEKVPEQLEEFRNQFAGL
jgi:hypothetical protein